MMLVNQTTITGTMWTSASTATGMGAVSIIEGGLSGWSYALATVPVLVLVTSAMLRFHFDRREDRRKEAAHRKLMGDMPDKIEGSDDA